MAPSPLVYVIVLSWNGKEDTMGCLPSLEPSVGDRVRVLVVDNGSTDGTYEAVRENFPWAEILRNEENLGFPGGNNVGIRHAIAMGADYVILLNNDTTVAPWFVTALVDAAAAFPDAGFLCSKIYYYDNPNVLWFAGATFSTLTGRSVHIGHGEPDEGQHDIVREIDRPCGCAVMVSRDLLEKVGLMDENLFLYGDEVDWALRARKLGFRCLYVPGSNVWHKVGATVAGERSGQNYYYAVRNLLFILRNHAPYRFPPGNWLRVLLVVSVFTASLFTVGIDKRSGLYNIWAGFLDYVRGRMGKRGM